jgi:diacylglycerol kinase (ATP)
MARSLILINPHAAGGAAAAAWRHIETDFAQLFGDPMVATTQTADELPQHLAAAAEQGITQVFSVGGDGTNHAVINAIMRHQQAHPATKFIYGSIPAGTGQDWARGLAMPLNTRQALDWLKRAQPRACDVGHVVFDEQERYFLNICSAGISNDVVLRVERGNKKLPWTFIKSTVESIMGYQPEEVLIEVDGKVWYEGRIYIIAIANGKYFGQGMKAAPDARIDDGLFDVLVVEGISRMALLRVLPNVYQGTHIKHPNIHLTHAKAIRVVMKNGAALGMDLDGEPGAGRELNYTMLPGALQILA